MTAGRVVVLTMVAALVVFCVVQDRVTAAGVREYVMAQRAAIARDAPPIPIDSVMRPAVHRSVVVGASSAGVVMVCGLSGAAAILMRQRRG